MSRRSLRSSHKRGVSESACPLPETSANHAKKAKTQETCSDRGQGPFGVFTRLEPNVSIDAAIKRLQEACEDYQWEEVDVKSEGVRIVVSSPIAFTALFLEAGLEPYKPHLCAPEAICVPFRPSLVTGNDTAEEKAISFQSKYLVFMKMEGGAPVYVYVGESKVKSTSSSGPAYHLDCLHLQCRHGLSAAGRDMLAWALRGCKKNKYKSYLCQLEAGTHSQSDNLPLRTPVDPDIAPPPSSGEAETTVKGEAGAIKEEAAVKNEVTDMALSEMIELVNAEQMPPGAIGKPVRWNQGGSVLYVSVGCLSEAACAIMTVWFRQNGGEMVDKLDWSMLGPDDARDYTNDVLAVAIASGRVQEVTLSTMHACPPLISDHLLAALGRGAATNTCRLVSVQMRSMAMSTRGRTVVLKGLAKCDGLKILVISNCDLGDEGISETAKLVWGSESHLKSLETVDLSANKCGDAGCEALVNEMCSAGARWGSLSVKSLVISEERVSDGKLRDGAALSLATLVRSTSIPLEDLKIARVNMGAKACAHLLEAIREVGALKALDISGNKFGNKGVPNVIACCKPDGPLESIIVSSSAVGSQIRESDGSNGACAVKIV